MASDEQGQDESANAGWEAFADWCGDAGVIPEHAEHGDVNAWVRELLGKHTEVHRVRFLVEALSEGYEERGLADPTGHSGPWAALEGSSEGSLAPQVTFGADERASAGSGGTEIVDPGGLPRPVVVPIVDSVTGLVDAGGPRALPPVMLGHETPAMAQATGRFYASVHSMFEAWLARRQSPNTRRAYRRDVLDFIEFMGIPTVQLELEQLPGSEARTAQAAAKKPGKRASKKKYVTSIDPDSAYRMLQATVPDVQAWRDYLQHEKNAAPNTLNRRVSSVSGLFRFMREAAAESRLPITVPNPAHSQFISREVQEPVSPTEALTATRARQLMALPQGESPIAYRDRAIMKFYLYTGSRIATGCRLHVEDFIDCEEDPKVNIQEKGRGKSKRAVGVNAIAADALREYIIAAGLTSGPLFRPKKNSRSEKLGEVGMDTSTMYRLVQAYLQQVPRAMREIELEDGEEVRACIYTPHSLRATTATLLLDAGEDIRDVQKLLGHKSVTVTQVYDKRRRGTQDSASHRLSI